MLTPIPIERISPISLEDFYQQYVYASKPVIISNLVSDWPAMQKWDLDYLSRDFGEVSVGYVNLVNNHCDLSLKNGSKLENISIKESAQQIAAGKTNGGVAIASPIDVFPEHFHNDYTAPMYCAGRSFLRSRIFIGPAGIITSLHQDLPENLYVMVSGKKRITLFPPASPVYRHSPFSKLPNHALTDPENPDYSRYPKFKHAQPYLAEVSAGDTLFIPSFWWHHLRNSESSIAVNFWWSQGWKLPIAWTAAMYKKIRGF